MNNLTIILTALIMCLTLIIVLTAIITLNQYDKGLNEFNKKNVENVKAKQKLLIKKIIAIIFQGLTAIALICNIVLFVNSKIQESDTSTTETIHSEPAKGYYISPDGILYYYASEDGWQTINSSYEYETIEGTPEFYTSNTYEFYTLEYIQSVYEQQNSVSNEETTDLEEAEQ